jgi:hypothetical protein
VAEPLDAKQPAFRPPFRPESLSATMHGIIACDHVNGTTMAK